MVVALVVVTVVGLAVGFGFQLTSVSRGVAAAERALDASDLVTAEAAWRAVLAEDPGRVDALYGLGWTLHLAGETEAARSLFQQCVDVHPGSPLGYKGLGSVAMASGDPALSRRRFEQALALAPGDSAVRHSLALLELSVGRVDRALAAFEALVAEEPGRPAFHQALAEALLAAGRSEEALTSATTAVRLAGAEANSSSRVASRTRALAEQTRARAILAATHHQFDAADCAGTAAAVHARLAEADSALDAAEATGVPIPELVAARRAVHRRRSLVVDRCPPTRAPAWGAPPTPPDG